MYIKLLNILLVLLLFTTFQNVYGNVYFEDNTLNIIMTPEYSKFNITWIDNTQIWTDFGTGQWCIVTITKKECFVTNKTSYFPAGSVYNMKFKIIYNCDFDNGYNQIYLPHDRPYIVNMTLYQSKNYTIYQQFISSQYVTLGSPVGFGLLSRYKYIIDDSNNIFEFDMFTCNISVTSPYTCSYNAPTIPTAQITTATIHTTIPTTLPRTHIFAPQQPITCKKIKGEHTETYYNWIEDMFSGNLFLPNTFVNNIVDSNDLATICRSYTRSKYLNFLRDKNIRCSGSWCINNEFSCKDNTDPNAKTVLDCYQGEHIIDRRNSIPEFAEDDKNIFGNIVMAYGLWNNQIGKLTWDRTEIEKREIYGDRLVNIAIENIRKCKIYNARIRSDTVEYDNNEDDAYDDTYDEDCDCELDEEDSISMTYIMIIVVVSSIGTTLLTIFVIFMIWKLRNYKKQQNDHVLLINNDDVSLDRDTL